MPRKWSKIQLSALALATLFGLVVISCIQRPAGASVRKGMVIDSAAQVLLNSGAREIRLARNAGVGEGRRIRLDWYELADRTGICVVSECPVGVDGKYIVEHLEVGEKGKGVGEQKGAWDSQEVLICESIDIKEYLRVGRAQDGNGNYLALGKAEKWQKPEEISYNEWDRVLTPISMKKYQDIVELLRRVNRPQIGKDWISEDRMLATFVLDETWELCVEFFSPGGKVKAYAYRTRKEPKTVRPVSGLPQQCRKDFGKTILEGGH